jgi:hypothetical protein
VLECCRIISCPARCTIPRLDRSLSTIIHADENHALRRASGSCHPTADENHALRPASGTCHPTRRLLDSRWDLTCCRQCFAKLCVVGPFALADKAASGTRRWKMEDGGRKMEDGKA